MTDETEQTVSNLTYAELVSFFQTQMGRVEMTWFRVMYLHAAIVGVLAFFAEAREYYMFQRGLVFAFYTVNLLIFHVSLQEGYQALKSAHRDLMRFPQGEGDVERWFRGLRYGYKTPVRIMVMVSTWVLIGGLLFLLPLYG